MENYPRFFFSLVMFLTLPVFALSGCSSSSTASLKWTDEGYYSDIMDAYASIHIYDPLADKSLSSSSLESSQTNRAIVTTDSVSAILQEYSYLSDNTQAYEGLVNVYTINQTNSPVKVSQKLFDLLSFAMSMKEATHGYFNPLVGGLSDLWKTALFGSSNASGVIASSASSYVAHLPSTSEIQAALSAMANTTLTFDEASLSVTRTGEGKIDLGGVAKGYSAEKVVEYLQSNGIVHYYMDFGSSTLIFGENIDGGDGSFSVGFSDLNGRSFRVKDCAVSTSAVARQMATVDGQIYSHLVNPLTGSALADWHGAVLENQNAAQGDALSTTFLLLGAEGVDEYLKEPYGVKALFYKSAKVYNQAYSTSDGTDTVVEKGLSLS